MDSIRHNSSLFFGSKQNLYGNVVSACKDGVKYKTEELSPSLDSDGFWNKMGAANVKLHEAN